MVTVWSLSLCLRAQAKSSAPRPLWCPCKASSQKERQAVRPQEALLRPSRVSSLGSLRRLCLLSVPEQKPSSSLSSWLCVCRHHLLISSTRQPGVRIPVSLDGRRHLVTLANSLHVYSNATPGEPGNLSENPKKVLRAAGLVTSDASDEAWVQLGAAVYFRLRGSPPDRVFLVSLPVTPYMMFVSPPALPT